ncbi:MAG: FtsX-like permease family protein, partial [Stackebrandtia sp.]
MRIAALSWRLLVAGGRRGALGSVLTLAAVTVSTALLLFAVSANHAFAERGDRTAWRVADADTSQPSALQASDIDRVGDEGFTRVDLAATGDGAPPMPPGMDHFPQAGEVWLSPALADLADELPASQLAERFPA